MSGGHDEPSTDECLVNRSDSRSESWMSLVITGGEPFVRPDILDIAGMP